MKFPDRKMTIPGRALCAPRALGTIVVSFALVVTPARPAPAQLPGERLADHDRIARLAGSGADTARTRDGLRVVLPDIRLVHNSSLPHTFNDRELWAGRGTNLYLSGGAAFSRAAGAGRITAQLAPAFTWSQNRPFQIYPWPDDRRSPYASPYFPPAASADLPMRFGGSPFTTIHPGESHLTIEQGPVAFGASSGEQWWGPAIVNTLVIGSNAPGIPRVFVRTSRPIATRIGTFDGLLIAGTLTESIFFDTLSANDYRSISGLLIRHRPAWEPSLLIGLSRVVHRPAGDAVPTLGDALMVLGNWESPRGDLEGDPDTRSLPRTDQIISLFVQWAVPGSGLEIFGEWARTELPRSVREFLLAPHHSHGYTAGFQLLQPLTRPGTAVRLHGEVTNLEQNTVFRDRPARDFYTGRVSEQGFTNRGQVIGAPIGPGSSSQWVAADYLRGSRSLGMYLGRIRWYSDAFYRRNDFRPARRDISLLAGLRGSAATGPTRIEAELTLARRFNYLFQNEGYLGTSLDPVDVNNVTLSLRVHPR